MRPTLAISTCSPQLEAALALEPGRGPASVVRLAGVSPRSVLLLAAVDLLLEDAGLTPERLGLVAVTRGPGSFTGIRAGLASAEGIAAGVGAAVVGYGSLLVQAARCRERGTVWTAQPGRRGEVYAQPFRVGPGEVPCPVAALETVRVADAGRVGPWIAAESVDLGTAARLAPARGAAEALLELVALGAAPEPLEPFYVEGPPIHGEGR